MYREDRIKIKHILLIAAGAIVVLLLSGAIYVYSMLSRMHISTVEPLQETIEEYTDEPTIIPAVSYTPLPTIDEQLLQTPAPTAEPETNEDYGVINIAVFGMDNRYKYTIIGGRSDVIMILTIDKKNNSVRLTSFIRDTLIYIEPLSDYNRINAAIVYADGPDGAVECIEQEFGIDIDHYMVTNFVGMARIIDAIGGAEAYVSSAVAKDCNYCIEEMNPLMGYSAKANFITSYGNIHLSGIQAVAFMRQRKHDGGFARDDKQKEILMCLKDSLSSLSIDEINSLLTVVSENVKTDMQPLELLQMTMYLYACKDGEYSAIRMPLDGTYKLAWYKKMSIVQYDKEQNVPQLYDFIYNGIYPYDTQDE